MRGIVAQLDIRGALHRLPNALNSSPRAFWEMLKNSAGQGCVWQNSELLYDGVANVARGQYLFAEPLRFS